MTNFHLLAFLLLSLSRRFLKSSFDNFLVLNFFTSFIEVDWEDAANTGQQYDTELVVEGYNRNGLLNEVLNVINSTTKSLNSVNGKVDANKMATISVNIGIMNTQQLDFIVDKIKQIPDVYSVRRVIS